MRNAIYAVCLVLAGCVTAKPIFTPSGDQGFSIECDSLDGCYTKAGQLCGARGYEILEKSGKSTPFFIANGGSAVAGSADSYSVIIRCK